MGILGNQDARNDYAVRHDYLDACLQDFADLAKKHGVPIETVIEAKRVLEMERRNSMDSLAGDYHDEHMGGLGSILTRIADALENR